MNGGDEIMPSTGRNDRLEHADQFRRFRIKLRFHAMREREIGGPHIEHVDPGHCRDRIEIAHGGRLFDLDCANNVSIGAGPVIGIGQLGARRTETANAVWGIAAI